MLNGIRARFIHGQLNGIDVTVDHARRPGKIPDEIPYSVELIIMRWKNLLTHGSHSPEMVEPLQVHSQERLSKFLDLIRGVLEIPDCSGDILINFKQ